ncbi:hypothetical protein RN001_007360 [Aquatica leii]|uniref:Uncharacterized protein n=1 Tax=Aquatica leii TaxID=1421715 RepID=A0AAN7PW94_9COLE|nr:hypothetical protein RN001_007360 [Aquatica leii]
MPEFRLEQAPRPEKVRPIRLLYPKNEYRPGIKISDWEKYEESLPKDTSPYCPGSLNYHLSHYKRLGIGPDEPFVTETHHMLSQHNLKNEVARLFHIPNKYMVNYYTYTDTLACEVDLSDKICPAVCAGSFDTTMQKSYPPPYPYMMQRFSFATPPFMLHRKHKWRTSDSAYKFHDDCYIKELQELQCIKKSKTASFNPMTLMNTDGTLPAERNPKCTNLKF